MSTTKHTPAFPRGIHIDGYWSADEWQRVMHVAARHRNSRVRYEKYKSEGSDITYVSEAVRASAAEMRLLAKWAIGATCREEVRTICAKATGAAA